MRTAHPETGRVPHKQTFWADLLFRSDKMAWRPKYVYMDSVLLKNLSSD